MEETMKNPLETLNYVEGFQPQDFLVNLAPEGSTAPQWYMPVQYRMLWFRLKYPNGVIRKKILKLDEKLVIVEAKVYGDKADGAEDYLASAWAQRCFDPTTTYGMRHVECAETSAEGRALGKAGFGSQYSEADPDEPKEPAPVDTPAGINPNPPQKESNMGLLLKNKGQRINPYQALLKQAQAAGQENQQPESTEEEPQQPQPTEQEPSNQVVADESQQPQSPEQEPSNQVVADESQQSQSTEQENPSNLVTSNENQQPQSTEQENPSNLVASNENQQPQSTEQENPSNPVISNKNQQIQQAEQLPSNVPIHQAQSTENSIENPANRDSKTAQQPEKNKNASVPTNDMTEDEIKQLMTMDIALNAVCNVAAIKGKKMQDVLSTNPSVIEWIIQRYNGTNKVMKAAAVYLYENTEYFTKVS